MNTPDKTDEQVQLERAVVRFTAQLHDLERERTDTLNALNTANTRLRVLQTEQARLEREHRERDNLASMIARLRIRIAENPYTKPTQHAQNVLSLLKQGRAYPNTAEALRAVSAALSGFNVDVKGEAYRARQDALAAMPLYPPKLR